jgi:hypothetical protein
VKGWLQSYKTNNPDLIAPVLADKFVNTGPDGKLMNKAESLADAKATKNTSADYENVHRDREQLPKGLGGSATVSWGS